MSTDTGPFNNITIVGGGSAGWMTACAFLRSLEISADKITLIESSNIPTIGVGEGTTPLFRKFVNSLGIPEAEFMSACNATYKHGISFLGWTNSEVFNSYFHPFASPGYTQSHQEFFNSCNQRRLGGTTNTNPADFFFNAEMAEQRKAPVAPFPHDTNEISYAYHFDAGLLADFFKQYCLDRGINYIVDDVTSVCRKEDGDISHLITNNGGKLFADFFVDCTGFRRMLIGTTLGAKAISYKPKLFNDSAVVIREPVTYRDDIPPFTESHALKCGWAWRIPLVDRIGWGYVYSSDYTSNDDAECELRDFIGDVAQDLPSRHLQMEVGRLSEQWKNNCVAIGLAQGFIEPLEATALGLTQFSINRFITHFARGKFQPIYRDRFNSLVNEAFDSTCDYIHMHYKLNTRDDTKYWRDCRTNDNISNTMRSVIAGWDSKAEDFDTILSEHTKRSSFPPYSWYCILSGMGRYKNHEKEQSSNQYTNPYQDEVSKFYSHQKYLDSN